MCNNNKYLKFVLLKETKKKSGATRHNCYPTIFLFDLLFVFIWNIIFLQCLIKKYNVNIIDLQRINLHCLAKWLNYSKNIYIIPHFIF